MRPPLPRVLPPMQPPVVRIVAALAVLLSACAPRAVAPTPVEAPPPPPVVAPLTPSDDAVRVTFFDVGQGDAALIETPCGTVLIDTGGETAEGFDGSRALVQFLDDWFAARPHLGRTIDLLVLSHPHIDHIRGAPEILERFDVRRVLENGRPGRDIAERPQRQILRWLSRHPDVPHETVALGDIPAEGLTDDVIDPLRCEAVDPELRVLWGRVDHDPGWGTSYGSPRFDNENNHSVVLRLDVGAASFLFDGDLEDVAIADLVARYAGTNLLDVDVYKVGHHGSHNGTTQALVDAMSPALAVMSMGPERRHDDWTAWAYGHPRSKAVDLLLGGLTCTRPAADHLVAARPRTFSPVEISRALYGTGWDGTVVVEATPDGAIRVLAPHPEQVCPAP